MKSPLRFCSLPALLAALAACSGMQTRPPGQTSGAAAVIQAAQLQANAQQDPVAAKLAVWLRAQADPTSPDAASAGEIDLFLRANPDWPGQAAMRTHLRQALIREPDDVRVWELCTRYPPDRIASLQRCIAALSAAPATAPAAAPAAGTITAAMPPPTLAQDVTKAWVAGAWIAGFDDPADEARFLALFGPIPSPDDQWRRFERQEWSGSTTAARHQIARLYPALRALATARIALRAGDDGADLAAMQLRGQDASDPTMLLDLARFLRRHDRDDDAFSLWRDKVFRVEQPGPHQAAFWAERDALARDLLAQPPDPLTQQRDREALALVQDAGLTDPAAGLDRDFLAGWILLRRLQAAGQAVPLFAQLTRNSRSLITTSRGAYWLAQALDAVGRPADAHDALALAAARPTTFYGQAAIRALSASRADDAIAARLANLPEPDWSAQDAIRFAGTELAHAATLLVAWGDPGHARSFLLRLDALAGDDRDHALGANFARRLGLPDCAVAIARNAGRHGLVLLQSGWPAPYTPPEPPALPPGFALSVMRQESSFDPGSVSHSGALGLMQLMPATARELAGSTAPALFDAQTNMVLGTRYLAELLAEFGGSTAYAAAAYNAGPDRLHAWLQQDGNPAGAGDQFPDAAMIDWIELIPFPETRNYVQRVIESETIYRLRPEAAGRIAWNLLPQ